MQIQWITKNEFGEEIVGNHPYLTIENVGDYAKHNCRMCHGRGYGFYDSGWEYNIVVENGQQSLERKSKDLRTVLCDCSIRTLSKTGL